MNRSEFARRLRLVAVNRGYANPHQLAQVLGVSDNKVHRWYSGQYAPRADTLHRICTTLGCSADYLLDVPCATKR